MMIKHLYDLLHCVYMLYFQQTWIQDLEDNDISGPLGCKDVANFKAVVED